MRKTLSILALLITTFSALSQPFGVTKKDVTNIVNAIGGVSGGLVNLVTNNGVLVTNLPGSALQSPLSLTSVSATTLTVTGGSFANTNSLSSLKPDFNLVVMLLQTNNNFTFLPPINVSNNLYQTVTTFITNSAAADKTITFPAGVTVVGTPHVTNLTHVDWESYAGLFTNAYVMPIR